MSSRQVASAVEEEGEQGNQLDSTADGAEDEVDETEEEVEPMIDDTLITSEPDDLSGKCEIQKNIIRRPQKATCSIPAAPEVVGPGMPCFQMNMSQTQSPIPQNSSNPNLANSGQTSFDDSVDASREATSHPSEDGSGRAVSQQNFRRQCLVGVSY